MWWQESCRWWRTWDCSSYCNPPPVTRSYCKTYLQRKRTEIWDDFYCTDAMRNKDWTRPLYDLRHAVTRLATHGFHFKCAKPRHITNQETNASVSGAGKSATGTTPYGVRKERYPLPNWVPNDCIYKPMHILCFMFIIKYRTIWNQFFFVKKAEETKNLRKKIDKGTNYEKKKRKLSADGLEETRGKNHIN